MWDAAYRADPKRYSRAALIGVIAAREAWADAGLRIGEPNAGVVIGSGGGGIDVGERQYLRLLRRARAQGHAVRHSDLDCRHDVERDLDLAAAARRQPRAVVRLHELDRRHRLRGGAHPVGRSGRALVGRRRRVRDARHDVRLRADARASRPPTTIGRRPRRGRSTAAATASCWAKAPGWSCSSAKTARGRAAHAPTRPSTATASTCDAYHRVQMAPDGEEIVRAIALAIRPFGPAARRHRLRQLSRHVHAVERRGRVAVRAPGLRRPRRPPRRIVGQVDDRPSPGRQRRGRGRHRRARDAAGFLPPTINLSDPDPACDLDYVPNCGRRPVEAALCNCLGFGSKNSALVIGQGELTVEFND